MARNGEVKFRLGWHVLKNMDTEKGLATVSKRDLEGKGFFSNGIWKEVPGFLLGITELNQRLSNIWLSQVSSELPSVVKNISSKRSRCQKELGELGQSRTSIAQGNYVPPQTPAWTVRSYS